MVNSEIRFVNQPHLTKDRFYNCWFKIILTKHDFVIFQPRVARVKSLQATLGAVPVIVAVAGPHITLHGAACADLPPVLALDPWLAKMATILTMN